MTDIASTSPASLLPSARRRWAALVVLVAGVLLLAIDGTVLYLAVPALTRDLGATSEQVLWIGDVYSLVLAGLLVTMGSLADRIGRKRLLLTGVVAFGLASLVAAFSASAAMLIAARVLLGVAGASIMPSTLALIRNIFTDAAERTKAIAIWSAAFGAGSAIGPLVGGLLLEYFWWGSVFLINVPVMLAMLIGGVFLLPESYNPHPGRFDLPSAALSLLTMTPLIYAIKHTVGSGFDLVAAACLVVGAMCGWLFVRRQRRLETPLLDVELFRIPAFTGAVLANVIAIFSLTGLLFFFSQYLQLVRGYSPLVAGLAELPSTIASIVVVAVVGAAVTWLGRGRAVAVGMLLGGAGLAVLASAERQEAYVWLAIGLALLGLGIGLAMTLTADIVVSAAPARKAGAVSAITETAYELGVVLGIALLGSLVTGLYRALVTVPAWLSAADRAAVQDSLASALTVLDPASTAAQAAREAFAQAMQTASLVAAVLMLAAAVVAWRLIPSSPGRTARPCDGSTPIREAGTDHDERDR